MRIIITMLKIDRVRLQKKKKKIIGGKGREERGRGRGDKMFYRYLRNRVERSSTGHSLFTVTCAACTFFNQLVRCSDHDSRRIVLISVPSPIISCSRWMVVYTVTGLTRPKSNMLHICSTKLRYRFFLSSSCPRDSKNMVLAKGIWQSPTKLQQTKQRHKYVALKVCWSSFAKYRLNFVDKYSNSSFVRTLSV